MDQSRQRATHPQIIDRPEFRTPLRRLTEGSITTILWAIWLYWLLPVVTVFLWVFGFKFLYQTLFTGEGFAKLFEILRRGGVAVVIILTLQLLWIYYNHQFIFKRKGSRRRAVPRASDKTLAQFFNLEPKVLAAARKKQTVKVTLKDNKLTIG
ncbi:MAG: poly-beta-1,6-N-acetyl-D-glucosamine biosynthesis protein PgaD [Candidatus Omnitrophica bacterium]|nr:poly-beta-1,6-N-acetyl-D-glucosamine biosynthesis protein PgaD [Candidatus Omnitrophota bacterium]